MRLTLMLYFLLRIGRQHYRLYVINHIPTLRVLDMQRISRSERDKAQRLARSAAGAALESDVQLEKQGAAKTFTPGEEKPIFSKEQKQQLREMVAAAKTPQEIEEIESLAQKGIFPSKLLDNKKRAAKDMSNGDDNTKKLKVT
mmetsp:Transcript_25830/g.39076  ORF Transcript_25830/g.39076 Transcript_25830/m.39076 type:complete len:143 (+) Transcript_25830:640-1068(+)